MFYFLSHALRMMYWNIHAKFHKNPSSSTHARTHAHAQARAHAHAHAHTHTEGDSNSLRRTFGARLIKHTVIIKHRTTCLRNGPHVRNPEPGDTPLLFSTPRVFYLYVIIDSVAHHQAFDKPARQHLYISTPQQPTQDLNPGPSEHESHTLCVSPSSKD